MSKVRLNSDGAVRTLTLDDPDRRNAIDEPMRAALAAAVQEVDQDPEARALVVTGAGTSFCAGADLPAMFEDTDRSVAQIRRDLKTTYDSFLGIMDLTIPTIAAVQGPAVGAGLNLALACDLRVAGHYASFAATFSRIGLHPGGGCTWFLVRALGPERAMALLLDGGRLTGPEAVGAGLAMTLADDPLTTATEMASRYCDLDSDLSRDIKAAVQVAARSDLATTLEFESWAQASSATRPEIQEAVARFRRP